LTKIHASSKLFLRNHHWQSKIVVSDLFFLSAILEIISYFKSEAKASRFYGEVSSQTFSLSSISSSLPHRFDKYS
jgi:hypothetical protein